MNRIVLLVLLLISLNGVSQENVSIESEIGNKTVDLLRRFQKVAKLRGSVLIYNNGKVIVDKAFGNANDDWNIPNTNTTKYRIGSITKPITALGILTLVQNNELGLETRLDSLYPTLQNLGEISILDLLTHSSGLPTDLEVLERNAHEEFPKDSILKLIAETVPEFKPGTQFNYSNLGYFLLGSIIEKISDKPYEKYITEAVLIPSKMPNTQVDDPSKIILERAEGYDDGPDSNGFATEVVANYIYPPNDLGNGSLLSTTYDLLNLYEAIKNNKIINEELTKKMMEPRLNGYGLGWWVNEEHKVFYHSGNIEGFTASFIAYPEADVCVILLCNTSNVQAEEIVFAIKNIVFGKDYYQPLIRKEVLNFEYSTALNRTYTNPYFNFELKILNGSLYVQTPGDSWEQLFPESDVLFFSKLHDFQVVFDSTEYDSGKIQFNGMSVAFKTST